MPGNSLRRLLLIWLLPASLAIMVASILIAYFIATRVAGATWDQSLLDAAEAYAERLTSHPAQIPGELPRGAERMLIADADDHVWFRLVDRHGKTLAGTSGLPYLGARRSDEPVRYADLEFEGHNIRLVGLTFDSSHGELEIAIGATMRKRDTLVRDIILGIIVPELVLFFAIIILMEIAVSRGLAPLDSMRTELAKRSHRDLRPLETASVPDELMVVVNALNDLLMRLQESISAQTNFVSDAAHQLRTPIAALQAQAEILRREGDSGQRDRLDHLIASSIRLSHLVKQLLALARAEPAVQSLEVVDFPSAIEDAASGLYPTAIAAVIDLGFELKPARTHGSPLMIRELVINLIENSLRYTPSPGTVTVRCRVEGEMSVIEVEDSGPGIAEPDRERVFERFYRIPGSGVDGSGLGLSIVREIARTHGGSASITSSPTLGGAKFVVRLPAC